MRKSRRKLNRKLRAHLKQRKIDHFKRAKEMFAKIVEARVLTGPVEQMAALQQIPAYVSRGHGRNVPFIKSVAMQPRSTYSIYRPHMGAKQIRKAHARHLQEIYR